jgi:two-component system sensor histidine kinase VicK
VDSKTSLLSVVTAIGDLAGDGIILYSQKNGKVLHVNDALARLFDISHKTFSNQPSFFINHILEEDISYLTDQYKIFLKKNVLEGIEFRVIGHDKTVRHVSASCYCLDGNIVGIFRDITQPKENENYIVEYGARKDTLLDMISHNLSGPLNLLQSFSRVLEEAVSEKNVRKIADAVNFIRQNTAHCVDIVNNFLEEEHLVSERIFVKRTRFDIVRPLEVVIERTRQSYPVKQIEFTFPSRPLFVVSDEVKMFQIFHNLVSNAVKFTADDGKVSVKLEETRDAYAISVTDNGIGIPADMRPRIFEKYTSAGRDGLRGEKSLGMGLYIALKLTELLQGAITFESEERKGSRFTAHFPKALASN